MTNIHSQLGELDEALASGSRALEIAGRLGDLRLRILTTSFLEQAHYFRGEYERAVELATENLAALPTDWVHESSVWQLRTGIGLRSPTGWSRASPSSADSPKRLSTKPR